MSIFTDLSWLSVTYLLCDLSNWHPVARLALATSDAMWHGGCVALLCGSNPHCGYSNVCMHNNTPTGLYITCSKLTSTFKVVFSHSHVITYNLTCLETANTRYSFSISYNALQQVRWHQHVLSECRRCWLCSSEFVSGWTSTATSHHTAAAAAAAAAAVSGHEWKADGRLWCGSLMHTHGCWCWCEARASVGLVWRPARTHTCTTYHTHRAIYMHRATHTVPHTPRHMRCQHIICARTHSIITSATNSPNYRGSFPNLTPILHEYEFLTKLPSSIHIWHIFTAKLHR